MRQETYIAATRFGLGPRPDEIARIETAPLAWLREQIAQPEAPSNDFSGLASAQQIAITFINARMEAAQKSDKADGKEMVQQVRKELRKGFIAEMAAKATHAMSTPTPFYERLVDFWSNHFSISSQKGDVAELAGAFEREAIRPRVTGNFGDLLLAVEQHPAMLIYLDNFQSIGPNSKAGQRTQKGLNENLAREIMELHTLGVDAGYTQADVTSFAKVLTGWGIGNETQGTEGAYTFFPNRHEPGNQIVFGKNYPDRGEEQGRDVLLDFANHAKTARHISFKLARHFIADEPPEAAVLALTQTFMQTGGDLAAVYRTLLSRPEAWSLQHAKIKSSYDLVISAIRLCGAAVDPLWYLQSLKFLGDVPLSANSPAGFPDTAKDLAGPEAILRRIEWAKGAANKLAPGLPLPTLTDMSIGPIMSATTRDTLAQATDAREGLALLLGSPEFQRR